MLKKAYTLRTSFIWTTLCLTLLLGIVYTVLSPVLFTGYSPERNRRSEQLRQFKGLADKLSSYLANIEHRISVAGSDEDIEEEILTVLEPELSTYLKEFPNGKIEINKEIIKSVSSRSILKSDSWTLQESRVVYSKQSMVAFSDGRVVVVPR